MLAPSPLLAPPETEHHPVLLQEAVAGLAIGTGGIYIDATFGRGGHSSAILDALQGSGQLHGIDQDPTAQPAAAALLARPGFHFHAQNFAELPKLASGLGITGQVNGLLMDLGVSSPQFDRPERGFSFNNDGPLDMRMNPNAGISAAQWIASADEEAIANVLYQFGEERNSRRIAKRIVETRKLTPLTSTAELAKLIASVPGPRSHKIHPATRSFQAIRIFINDELGVLDTALKSAIPLLALGGRLAVISFHSLEDRMVKRFIRNSPELDSVERIFPSDAECARNPRARSAVLRIAERVVPSL